MSITKNIDNLESHVTSETEILDNNSMAYNTTQPPLKMQEYGRLVLQMVDFAMTLETKEVRTAYAYEIIRVMAGLNPQMKNVPDYQLKLWDYLAYLSDYKLDIDYPVQIRRQNENLYLHRLSYPGNKIRLRHYGYLVEDTLRQIVENGPSAPERSSMIARVAERMRRNLIEWKGDTADDERIARDISHYTDNAITIDEVMQSHENNILHVKRGRRK